MPGRHARRGLRPYAHGIVAPRWLRRARIIAVALVALPLLTGLMVVWHERSHTVAAWLAGDPSARFARDRSEPVERSIRYPDAVAVVPFAAQATGLSQPAVATLGAAAVALDLTATAAVLVVAGRRRRSAGRSAP